MSSPFHLLVVDDDERLRKLLEKYLKEQNFMVTTAQNTLEACEILSHKKIDLMVLDLMMPGESGLDFLERVRSQKIDCDPHLPTLMLTAQSEPEHRIKGLQTGADDYLSKPFEPLELVLRIKNLLHRMQPVILEHIRLGQYRFDLQQHALFKGQDMIYLTSVECSLLTIFAHSPNVVINREELAERSGVTLSPRTVDVQITRLRRKIEDNPKNALYLRTIRHQGYILCPDP